MNSNIPGVLLSIVIPTYNRSKMLINTIQLFREQLKRNFENVELIICCNACTDNTISLLDNLDKQDYHLKIINYQDHVDVGNSIKRSLDNATGKYILLWGDDDIPGPMMIDYICMKLIEYPGIGCLSFSRLNGTSYGLHDLRNLIVFNGLFHNYEKYYKSSKQFVIEHYSEMDFLSINVILKEAWSKGQDIDTSTHYGFNFLAPILIGIQGYDCLYLEFPLCIKRDVPLKYNSYSYKWPLYAYIGIPHILKCLEANSIIENWKELFEKYRYNVNDDEFFNNIFLFCYKNSSFYSPYIKEMASYQSNRFRRKAILFATKSNFCQRIIKIEFYALKFFRLIIQHIR